MRLIPVVIVFVGLGFNPRICKRCDFGYFSTKSFGNCFNPRICKRCDLVSMRQSVMDWCFNPRICKRCDQVNMLINIVNFGFNPRICKRCDSRRNINRTDKLVSIHASVKDATRFDVNVRYDALFQSTHL